MPTINRSFEIKHTNRNNHFMRIHENHFGLHLEIGFNGDYHDKKSSYEIDVNLYDLKQFRKMLDTVINELEGK